MNKSLKAALLSAFVFPGAGHFYLKKHLTGTVLAGAAFASIYLLISQAVERALQIVEKIQAGEVQLDLETITELVSRQAAGTEAQLLHVASYVFLLSWLIGIVDSYRAGRGQGE